MNPKFKIFNSIGIYLSLLLLLSCTVKVGSAQSDLDLVIHNIEATPAEGIAAYNVDVFFSALDQEGIPIMGLSADNFSILENSQPVEINTVSIRQSPVSLVLVIDTSGSMVGNGIAAARTAASNFIGRLDANDEVAVISFNDKIKQEIDFTNSKTRLQDSIQQIQAINRAGTCLYDAAYQAVELSTKAPVGTRGVIILTDGVDEIITGQPCSVRTIDDLINFAAPENANVPIFTIGLGKQVDEKILRRISTLTGGLADFSVADTQLNDLFDKLSNRLKNEYVIQYTSTNPPGASMITVEIKYNTNIAQATRKVILPSLPTSILMNSPADGSNLSGIMRVSAITLTQSEDISRMVFTANGINIGEVYSAPYAIEWDTTSVTEEQVILRAIALGKDGNELASSQITVINPRITEEAAEVDGLSDPSAQPTELASPEEEIGNLTVLQIILIAVGIFILFGVLVILIRKRAKKKPNGDNGFRLTENTDHKHEEGATIDGLATSSSSITNGLPVKVPATLKVIQSDDLMTIDDVYNLTKQVTTIGRDANSDILITKKETPVSRKHATITFQDGKFFLAEDLSTSDSGQIKYPTYGTFVNDIKVKEGEKITLSDGDKIRLGSRFIFLFSYHPKSEDGGMTTDNIQPFDLGETRESV